MLTKRIPTIPNSWNGVDHVGTGNETFNTCRPSRDTSILGFSFYQHSAPSIALSIIGTERIVETMIW